MNLKMQYDEIWTQYHNQSLYKADDVLRRDSNPVPEG